MTKISFQNGKRKDPDGKIYQTFQIYLKRAYDFLNDNKVKKIKYLDLYSNNRQHIEKLESGEEFFNLSNKVKNIESPFIQSQPLYKLARWWETGIKNFFRRSNCYINILENKLIDKDKLCEKFLALLKNEQTHVSYYAFIESVEFPKNKMDFGSFKICRFNESELNLIFSNTINQMFYPHAKIDSNKLKDYWFICIDKDESFEKPSFGMGDRIRFEHSPFEKNLELVLKKIALFGWGDFREDKEYWNELSIPYVFAVDENLLNAPPPIFFDYSKLLIVPDIDPYTSEEFGDKPVFLSSLNERFEKDVLEVENLFNILINNDLYCSFIDNALGHFLKAFCSQGIEQFIWHIFAIEALLGGKADGLTDRLARRISFIIKKEPDMRKKIYSEFKNLYIIRSNLVHGNLEINKDYSKRKDEKKTLKPEQLYVVRDLSRNILLWFVKYISQNSDNFKNKNNDEIHQAILDVIDFDPEKILTNNNLN